MTDKSETREKLVEYCRYMRSFSDRQKIDMFDWGAPREEYARAEDRAPRRSILRRLWSWLR